MNQIKRILYITMQNKNCFLNKHYSNHVGMGGRKYYETNY